MATTLSSSTPASSSSSSLPTTVPTLFGVDQIEVALLTASIAKQMDERFMSMDLSVGSRIVWGKVVADMKRATGKEWNATLCQRLWRFVAYGEDIGEQESLLPDSDGEDEPIAQFTAQQLSILPAPSAVQAVELLDTLFHDVITQNSSVPPLLSQTVGSSSSSAPKTGNGNAIPNTIGTDTRPTFDINAARAAMGLTDAEHTVVDSYVRMALGSPPEPKRSALTLYILKYQSEIRQIRSSRLNIVRLRVHRAQQNLQRATNNNNTPVEEINNRKEYLLTMQQQLLEEMTKDTVTLLHDQWNEKLTPTEKEEWIQKAVEDTHRAEEELRIYEERYTQFYRAVAYRAYDVGKKVHPLPGTETVSLPPVASSQSSSTTTTTEPQPSSSPATANVATPATSNNNNENNSLSNATLLKGAVTRPQMKIYNGQSNDPSGTTVNSNSSGMNK